MNDQLIAVFVAVIAEPILRFVKRKFALEGPVMLLVTVIMAAIGGALIVLQQEGAEGFSSLDSFLKLVPTIFAVGQVIFALLK